MQISRNSLTLLVGAAASAMILSACGGGSSSTPTPQAQAALTVAAASTSLSTGGTTNLSTTGGSGAGAVTYQATGGCTVSGSVLTAPSTDATCSVTATKAADGSSYLQATSTNTVTVTVTLPTTTFLTFDESTAPTLTPFSSANTLAATIETDPAGGSNKVAKLVKSAGSDTWAGATLSKCVYPTNALPVIPLSATNKKMSLRVYSTVANKVVRLKLEDGLNGTHSVETEATVTAANTWQTLTFDFGSVANGTGAWDATYTYNKASAFPDFGNTTAVTMFLDDLKFVGVANVAQTCITPPPAPTAAATAPTVASSKVIALYSDTYSPVATGAFPTSWSNPTSGSDLTIGGNTARKLGSLVFAGLEPTATIDATTYTKFNISVWTSTGTTFKVKLVDFGADGAYQGGDDVEHELTLTAPTQNAWTYYSINLSDFTGLSTKGHIAQIIVSGSGGDYYIDDIYFSKP